MTILCGNLFTAILILIYIVSTFICSIQIWICTPLLVMCPQKQRWTCFQYSEETCVKKWIKCTFFSSTQLKTLPVFYRKRSIDALYWFQLWWLWWCATQGRRKICSHNTKWRSPCMPVPRIHKINIFSFEVKIALWLFTHDIHVHVWKIIYVDFSVVTSILNNQLFELFLYQMQWSMFVYRKFTQHNKKPCLNWKSVWVFLISYISLKSECGKIFLCIGSLC